MRIGGACHPPPQEYHRTPRKNRDGHTKARQVHRGSGARSPATTDPREDERGEEAARAHSGATQRGQATQVAATRLEAPGRRDVPGRSRDAATAALRTQIVGPKLGPLRASPAPRPGAAGTPAPPPRRLHRRAASSRWRDGLPPRSLRGSREALGPAAPFTCLAGAILLGRRGVGRGLAAAPIRVSSLRRPEEVT
jgi:hypothetical protein